MSAKTTLLTFGLVFGIATTAKAAEPAAVPGKFALGLRLGYGVPMGDAIKNNALSEGVSGDVPIWLDLGYMVTQNFMVGLYGQYAFASYTHCGAGLDCSASDIRFGVQGQYHSMPTERFDPWIGLGIGYEILATSSKGGGMEASAKYMGMEYLHIQGGADFKLTPAVGVGPFISISLGQYSRMTTKYVGLAAAGFPNGETSSDIPSDQTTLHEWFTFGVHGTFSL